MPPRPERMDNFTGLKRRCEMFQDYKCLELNSFFGRCRVTVLHCTRFSFTLVFSVQHPEHIFGTLCFCNSKIRLVVYTSYTSIMTFPQFVSWRAQLLFDGEARTPITRVIVDRVLVQLHVSCDSVRKRSCFWSPQTRLENVPAYH